MRLFDTAYKRYMHQEVNFSVKLIGIVGVGKTTFLLQHLREIPLPSEKKLYFSADDLDIDSLFDVAYAFSKEGGELLIIDEIHKHKHFERELKKIYDMLTLKVIFSGSSRKTDDKYGHRDIPSIFSIEYEKIISLKKLVRLVCESPLTTPRYRQQKYIFNA